MQIDVPETLGLGKRSGFYEAVGAFRDMVVTHLFQILAFMAMEPPTALEPAPIGEEKNKVFRSMLPLVPADVVRGQYTGYRAEAGVDPESDTETFIALKCSIDNWRWAGVPFYLRTGKRLAEGQRIISIAFREPPKSMFPAGSGVSEQGPDHLTFDLADAAKMSLSFYGKRPGPGMRLDKQSLQFAMHETGLAGDVLEAYERLILDAMKADRTLFTTAEGIERLWELSTALLQEPLAGPSLRAGILGAERNPSARRAACLAAALRTRLAGPESNRQLILDRAPCKAARVSARHPNVNREFPSFRAQRPRALNFFCRRAPCRPPTRRFAPGPSVSALSLGSGFRAARRATSTHKRVCLRHGVPGRGTARRSRRGQCAHRARGLCGLRVRRPHRFPACPGRRRVCPANAAEVQAVMAICHRLRVPVVARGAGTGLSGGSLPVAGAVLLVLARLNQILELAPRRRLARVQPGVTNLSISKACAAHALFYAPDPSSQIACSIGGNVAENSGGVHCLKYGITLHNILEIKVVTVERRAPRRSAAEMGEAPGYALTALLTGSEGMLGIIVEVTVKLLPRPGAR